MTKLRNHLSVLAALCAFVLAGCSDSDKQEPVVFPDLQKLTLNIGETNKVSLTATNSWQLTSSAVWLNFVNGEKMENSVSGNAGDIRVEFLISGEGAEINKTNSAQISMTMGGESKVVYEITRNGLEFTLTAIDNNNNELNTQNPVLIDYTAGAEFTINGNFKWSITQAPEWITFINDCSANAGVDHTVQIIINPDYVKDAATGEMLITDETGTASFSIPVSYDGIPEGLIIISGLSSPWNWHFSHDGSEYFREDPNGGFGEAYQAPMIINVIARNNEYELIYLENSDKWGCTILQYPSQKWFNAYDDDGNGKLEVVVSSNTTDANRNGYLLAMPKSVYESIKDDLDSALFDDVDGMFLLKDEIASSYVALNVIQECNISSNPFTIEPNVEIFQMEPAVAKELYNIESGWVVSLEKKDYDVITLIPTGSGSIFPESYINGVDMAWTGVEFETGFDMALMKQIIKIYGVKANSFESGKPMAFYLSTGEPICVVTFEQW